MTTPDAADRLIEFARCQSAEEYFALLEVAYDPRVVSVNRLHILRHFAEIARTRLRHTAPETLNDVLGIYRDALLASYQAFTTSTALDHRLFKVLRHCSQQAFVPVVSVTVRPGERAR